MLFLSFLNVQAGLQALMNLPHVGQFPSDVGEFFSFLPRCPFHQDLPYLKIVNEVP